MMMSNKKTLEGVDLTLDWIIILNGHMVWNSSELSDDGYWHC